MTSRTKTPLHLTLLAASAALLLTGCAEIPDPPYQQQDTAGVLVPYVGELESMHDFGWDQGSEEVDGNRIRIEASSTRTAGLPTNTCLRYAAQVVETAEDVTISIMTGRLPGTEELCDERKPGLFERADIIELAAVGYTETLLIELDAPLGDRELIQGEWMPSE